MDKERTNDRHRSSGVEGCFNQGGEGVYVFRRDRTGAWIEERRGA